jgi:haloalkane dehalogenase
MGNEKEVIPPSGVYPFESRYVSIGGHRIHYIEEGMGEPLLFLHGNPTWSYLWRNIMPKIAHDAGRRCIAMDLLGFGKSDKPPDLTYTAHLHYDIVAAFIEKLGLRNLVLVLHGWGGPIGTAYAVLNPENVKGIALMETFLWNLSWKDFGSLKRGIRLFRSPLGFASIQATNTFVNRALSGGVLRKEHLTEQVMQRYCEPFPTIGSRRAIRAFPRLLPIEGVPPESEMFMDTIGRKLASVKFPVLWIKATPGVMVSRDSEYHLSVLKRLLPQLIIKDFGPGLHYLQEDNPEKIAGLVTEWMHQCGFKTGQAPLRSAQKAA